MWEPPKPCAICGNKYSWSTSIQPDRMGNEIDYYFQCYHCSPPEPNIGHKVFRLGDMNAMFKLTTGNPNYHQKVFEIVQ